eukprot:g1637.t1
MQRSLHQRLSMRRKELSPISPTSLTLGLETKCFVGRDEIVSQCQKNLEAGHEALTNSGGYFLWTTAYSFLQSFLSWVVSGALWI